MNYGLYLSAGGALANMFRQDLYANNLANANTVGFKPDIAQLRQRLPERLESGAGVDPRQMLERLGGGIFGHTTRISLAQGDLIKTNNDLDVAIRGEGFFTVGSPDNQTRYLTRDGRFTLDAEGRLSLATNGMAVLDTEGEPIMLDRSAPVAINRSGDLIQRDRVVASLRLVMPSDTAELRKVGHNLFRTENPDSALVDAGGTLLQRHVENSATDPIMSLMDMIGASKAMQANVTLMQYHDQVLGQAINTFGRVA